MTCKCSSALEGAYDAGKWAQALFEAERAVEIYSSKAARLRPAAAWAVLPLALPIEVAVELIASAPVEDDAKGWVEHLFRLQERVARVRQQKELWNMTDDKRH